MHKKKMNLLQEKNKNILVNILVGFKDKVHKPLLPLNSYVAETSAMYKTSFVGHLQYDTFHMTLFKLFRKLFP